MTTQSQSASALVLERPIAFLDVDSTGLDPRAARIVRLTVLKLMPDAGEHIRSVLVNPGCPIPPGATRVHGITDEDVVGQPVFKAYARALADHLDGCDLAGYGIEKFDLPLLMSEFRRAGVEFTLEGRAVVDSMAIFHRLEPRDLAAAHRRYAGGELPGERQPDTLIRAACAVLMGQLRLEPRLPRTPAELAAWARGVDESAIDPEGRFVWSDGGEPLVNFGRYRGERLIVVASQDPSYLEWMAANREFSLQTRKIAEDAAEGYLPSR